MFLDLHTHILFDVDDGSKDLEMSIQMIHYAIEQKISHIVLTPHVQSRATRASRDQMVKHFDLLSQEVGKLGLPIKLYLGAEVLYHTHIEPDYRALTFGKSNYILIEFSMRDEQPIEEIIYDISRMGFIPIVAHMERYPYVKLSDYIAVKRTGALIQVNTTSILGKDKTIKSKQMIKLIKEGYVDLIASDTHNLDKRPPNLMDCYTYLKKHIDTETLDKLFFENTKPIIDAMS